MVATMIDRRQKLFLKQNWLKHPKAVPKITKFGPKCKWFHCRVWKSFFENIISGIQNFFNIRFSSRKSQWQQKLAKKVTNFTIQFRSKALICLLICLQTSTHLTLKIRYLNICCLNTAKSLSDLQISQQTYFCFVSEKTFPLPHFLTP